MIDNTVLIEIWALVAGSNTIWALEPYLILANMNFSRPTAAATALIIAQMAMLEEKNLVY